MCEVSDKIMFCTCDDQTPPHLLDYRWELKRRDKNFEVIGSISSSNIDSKILEINNNVLLNIIEKGQCFDFEYTPSINDKLSISLLFDKKTGDRMEFDYVFKVNGWTNTCDAIELLDYMENDCIDGPYITFKYGQIKQPYKNY